MKILTLTVLLILSACNSGGGGSSSGSSGGGNTNPDVPDTEFILKTTLTQSTTKNIAKIITLTNETVISSDILVNPSKGTLSGVAPLITYTPNSNQTGSDTFSYKMTTSTGKKEVKVNLTIVQNNTIPVSNNLIVFVQKGGSVTFNLDASDEDGDTLVYEIVDLPLTGRLYDLGQLGKARGYDAPISEGTTYMYYRVSDGVNNSNIATVEIRITRINASPVFTNNTSFTILEDAALNFNLTVTDSDGDVPALTISQNPTNGIISGTRPNIIYTPTANYFGTDTFKVKADDSFGGIKEQLITVVVQPVADAPVANNMFITTLANNDASILLNVTDADTPLNQLSYQLVNPIDGYTNKGIVNLSGQYAFYFPNLDQKGTDSFTYKVINPPLQSNTATVSIFIDGADLIPFGFDQDITIASSQVTNLPLTGRYDETVATFELLNQPEFGTLSGTAPNYIYTPNPNLGENKIDGFSYQIREGTKLSAPVSIIINITYLEKYLSFNNENTSKVFDSYTAANLANLMNFNNLHFLTEKTTLIIPADPDNNVEEVTQETFTTNVLIDKTLSVCENNSEDFSLLSLSKEVGEDSSVINLSSWTCSNNKYITSLSTFNFELYRHDEQIVMKRTNVIDNSVKIFFGIMSGSALTNLTVSDLSNVSLENQEAKFVDLSQNRINIVPATGNLVGTHTKSSNSQVAQFLTVYGENPVISVNAVTGLEERKQVYSEIVPMGLEIKLRGKYYIDTVSGQMKDLNEYYTTLNSSNEVIVLPPTEGIEVGTVLSYDNKIIIRLNQYAYGESLLVDKSEEEVEPGDEPGGMEYVRQEEYKRVPHLIFID